LGGTTGQPGTGGRSAAGGTTSQPGTGGATAAGGNAGRDGGSATGGAGGGTAIDGGGGSGAAVPSAGCGKTPALKNSGYNTLTSGGTSRQYYLRWPPSYDNSRAYRLILGLHGATGKGTDVAPGFWGLYDLSNGSTIFIAPDASGGLWSAASDTTFVDDILKAVEADLCIDTTRVELEGFSQGAAMSWTLACSRPGVFRAAVGHSGGGVANPTTCQPVAYMGSGGLQENVTQTTQTDQFAKWDGCTIETFAKAPTGGHSCFDYKGCSAGHPVRWCPYDGPHTPSPTDSGKSTSWMPSEVWPFLSQF
jgi:poly(3-hydroxybutyrate) depolymerase